MTDKTTSTTLCIGEWTYIFLNKPSTKFIDFIRFKDPSSPAKGVIGTLIKDATSPIPCNPGPLDALTIVTDDGSAKHIRLFYIGDDNSVKEIRLQNADAEATDPKTGWLIGGKGSSVPGLLFEKQLSIGSRTVDSSSFLSTTIRGSRPVVVFKSAGTEDFMNYAYFDTNDKWKLEKLDIPED